MLLLSKPQPLCWVAVWFLFGDATSPVQDGLRTWFGCDLERLNIVGTYNLLYNASLMVEEGVCYALCLDRLIHTGGESRLCFRPLANQVTAGMDLVWKKYQVFSRAAEAFLEVMREQIGSRGSE